MVLHIKNEHLTSVYPLLSMYLAKDKGITYSERSSGKDYSAINISTIDELFTILSLAKATNEYCTGIYFDGTSLVLSEKPYTLGE